MAEAPPQKGLDFAQRFYAEGEFHAGVPTPVAEEECDVILERRYRGNLGGADDVSSGKRPRRIGLIEQAG